jgi:hypothetical protein
MDLNDQYAEAWKRTLAAYEGYCQSNDATDPLETIEECRVLFGDPNKSMPLGRIEAPK